MQGVSTSKHQHLVDALLQLESLLKRDFTQETDFQLASELRSELEALFGSYNRQVMALSYPIGDYHELFNKAKIPFLSPKLKKLRKQVQHDKSMFQLLTENIRVAYGT